MSAIFANISAPFDFSWFQQVVVINGAIARLLTASVLGAIIGLEREVKRRSAGVRTNLLICMGAAFFTLLSAVLAGDASPNKGQVASNIVQGIGFLGAGSPATADVWVFAFHVAAPRTWLDRRPQHKDRCAVGGRPQRPFGRDRGGTREAQG